MAFYAITYFANYLKSSSIMKACTV